MLISQPNDGMNIEYHVTNLYGHVIHAYLDEAAAKNSLEGDQRIFKFSRRGIGHWVGSAPCIHPDIREV